MTVAHLAARACPAVCGRRAHAGSNASSSSKRANARPCARTAVRVNAGEDPDQDVAPPDEGCRTIVITSGKGGVGKTTSSSAIATLFAKYGKKRTLLVSTDPAHSLGDAFRMDFSGTPTSPMANLDVMEIDPSESMKTALSDWAGLAEDMAGGGGAGSDKDMRDRIASFQEWLSGIPGIDEATALSQAITHIESGQYDVIVFDTAPTGHTLKLLALPDILQAGITKLQSWQATLYGYWDAMKGLASTGSTTASAKRGAAKKKISQNLEKYKRDIQKVALMLQDQARTRFVVVCIAEFLSVSETKRLLAELRGNQVKASHVIVNQLVTQDALDGKQLEELEALAEVGGLSLNQELLQRTIHACRLTTSRKAIQTKYLDELRNSEEATGLDGLCEVPLLPEEVTGVEALQRFASLLVEDSSALTSPGAAPNGGAPANLYDDQIRAMNGGGKESEDGWTPTKGDAVQIQNLAKSAQYNNLAGTIVANRNEETGRYGVQISHQGKQKVLALQLKNIRLESAAAKKPKLSSEGVGSAPAMGGGIEGKISKLLEDPELKALIAQNPKFEAAVKECIESPMNAMKYLSDPEMSPLITKIMAKMM